VTAVSEPVSATWIDANGGLPLPWLASSLKQALAHQGHALLLHGPPGVGQFELAMVLAQSWLCEARHALGAPACGHCEACHLMRAGAHPDLMVLVPEAMRASLGLSVVAEEGDGAGGSAKKTPSGGREIRVSDVRKAIDWGHQTSSRGQGKVLVLFPAQALNRVAANALLKTLEEPAGSLRLVLSTFNVQALLPTLRSRCQMLTMPVPSPQAAQDWLREQGLEAPEILWNGAGGRPQEALAMLHDGLDTRMWPEVPAAVRLGRADVFQGLPLARVVDTLQKVCLDLMSRVQGAPAQYFPQEALPTGARAQALGAWWQRLQRTARHEDHPWNASLLIESLVLQGRQCWPPLEAKKTHVR
jgi:DNA polymerase-3 subunit delta'